MFVVDGERGVEKRGASRAGSASASGWRVVAMRLNAPARTTPRRPDMPSWLTRARAARQPRAAARRSALAVTTARGDARRKRVEGVVADAHRAPRRRAGLGADRRGEQTTGLNQRGRIAGLEEGGGGEGGEGCVDAEALGASAAIGTVAHHVGEAPQGELAHAVGGVGMGQHRADRLGEKMRREEGGVLAHGGQIPQGLASLLARACADARGGGRIGIHERPDELDHAGGVEGRRSSLTVGKVRPGRSEGVAEVFTPWRGLARAHASRGAGRFRVPTLVRQLFRNR